MVKKFGKGDGVRFSRFCAFLAFLALSVAMLAKPNSTLAEAGSFCATGRGRRGTRPEEQNPEYRISRISEDVLELAGHKAWETEDSHDHQRAT